MKYLYLLAVSILSFACGNTHPHQGNHHQRSTDTVFVAHHEIPVRPFKTEPTLSDFEKKPGWVKLATQNANKYDETRMDQVIQFTRGDDKIVFYQTTESTFLESCTFTTPQDFLQDYLFVGAPIDVLLEKIQVKIDRPDFVVSMNDEEETGRLVLTVKNRLIEEIRLEYSID